MSPVELYSKNFLNVRFFRIVVRFSRTSSHLEDVFSWFQNVTNSIDLQNYPEIYRICAKLPNRFTFFVRISRMNSHFSREFCEFIHSFSCKFWVLVSCSILCNVSFIAINSRGTIQMNEIVFAERRRPKIINDKRPIIFNISVISIITFSTAKYVVHYTFSDDNFVKLFSFVNVLFMPYIFYSFCDFKSLINWFLMYIFKSFS